MKKTILFAAIAVTLVSSIWAAPKTVNEMLEKESVTITGMIAPVQDKHDLLRDYWGKKTSAVVGLDDAFSFSLTSDALLLLHAKNLKNITVFKNTAVIFPKSLPYAKELESLVQQLGRNSGAAKGEVTYVVTKFLDKYCQWGWDFYYVTSVDESSIKAVVDGLKSEIAKREREKDPEYQRQQAELKEKERLASSIAGMRFAIDRISTNWTKIAGEEAKRYCEIHHVGKTCPKLIFSITQGWESHVAYYGGGTVKENGKIEVKGRELKPVWMVDKNAVLSDLDSNKQFLAFYEVEGDSIIILAKNRTKLRHQEAILEADYRLAELRELEDSGKKDMARRGYVYDYMWTGEWIKQDDKAKLDASVDEFIQTFGY